MVIIKIILLVVCVPLSVHTTVVAVYLGVVTLGAWCFRKRTQPGAPALRMALLIPAHNEEETIGAVLTDAAALDYPAEQFDVLVIADNCTDRTAELVRESGGQAFERHDAENPGKGQAIDWCLHEHRDVLAKYDAIAMVDADMQVSPGFLREMSETFAADDAVQVVQGLNTVSKPETSWRSALGYLGFMVINLVRPTGRSWLGGTAELKGSGMAFRAPLLLEYGWPCHSLAEDVEFSKRLLLDGVLVQFNPDALVTSEIPAHASQVRVQQQRWEGGRFYIYKTYPPMLLRALLAKPSVARLDALLDILVPPQSLLFLELAVALVLATILHPVWGMVQAICIALVGACIVSGLLLRPAPAKVWLYLAAVPLLIAWKLVMYVRLALGKGQQTWQRTPRDGEVDREQ